MASALRNAIWVLVGLVAAFMVVGAWLSSEPTNEWDAEYFDYGQPTPLAANRPLREAFCSIRADFATLPDPLIAHHKHHSAWTERRFAAGRFDYGPVQQLVLTQPALEFVRRHSRAEVIASLAPLMASPEGGRAAAVLAGLPVRSKAALSSTTPLADEMYRLYSRDNTARRPLDEQAIRQGPPLRLYGATNTNKRLERPVRRSRRGSFEAHLEPILEARADLPISFVDPPVIEPASPFRGKRSSVASVVEAFPMPELAPQLIEFAQAYPREDLLITLFPYVAAAQPGSRDLAVLIWASDLQAQYWPLAVSSPSLTEDATDELRNRFAAELIALCE